MNTHKEQKERGKKPVGAYIRTGLHKRLKLSCVAKGETISDRLNRLIEQDLKNE
jgi:hypothetical protein